MTITYLEGVGFTQYADATVYPANSVVQDPSQNASSSTHDKWFYTVAGGTSNNTNTQTDTGVTWVAYTGERLIGTEWYAYKTVIDGNAGTAEQIYEFSQFQLRQTLDIDAGAGTVDGNTANVLLSFVGDTLKTETGVFVDDTQAADANRLQFVDTSGTTQTYPFVAAGKLLFNDNLQDDADSIYRVFFTNDDAGTNQGYDYGTTDAITIDDNSLADIAGSVSANASSDFDFDYQNNAQRGAGSANTDAPFTAVAVGLAGAQFVVTTGTINRSTSNSINFVAALERNYAA